MIVYERERGCRFASKIGIVTFGEPVKYILSKQFHQHPFLILDNEPEGDWGTETESELELSPR